MGLFGFFFFKLEAVFIGTPFINRTEKIPALRNLFLNVSVCQF